MLCKGDVWDFHFTDPRWSSVRSSCWNLKPNEVVVTSNDIAVPYPGDSITSYSRKYTPSFVREQSFSKFLLCDELLIQKWNAVYLTDSQKKDCTIETAYDKTTVTKICQSTSEELRFCKRRRRDLLLNELRFLCLQSRYTAPTDHQKIANENEAVEAKGKSLFVVDGDVPDFCILEKRQRYNHMYTKHGVFFQYTYYSCKKRYSIALWLRYRN